MPKYSGAPERRKRHRHIVVIAVALAVLLAGGAAWASTNFQSDTASRATDSDAAGTAEDGPAGLDGDQVAKALRTTDQLKGPRWSQHRLERPTPTPTPSPTKKASPTEEPSPKETPSETPDPDPTDTKDPAGYPTRESTGPTIPISSLKPSSSLKSEKAGQVIEGLDVTENIKIIHDDVTVRNVRLTMETAHYGLHISKKNDGSCPQDVVIENVEVSGTANLDDESIAVYSPCPYTLRDSRIVDVGSAVRITHGTVIADNFILANHRLDESDSHRSAIGLNGGANHVISGNNIDCEGPGCSGALVMYGDFAQVQDVLVENNLLNSTGSYCTYAGSLDSKPYPVAKDVRYVNNEFGRKHFPTCGRYGPLAGRDSNGGPGFVWEANTWADTGEPVE